MKILKLMFVFCFSLFGFNLSVDALMCDKEEIDNLKELASYVEYDYEVVVGEEGIYNLYYVYVRGLNEQLYIVDGDGNEYYYNQIENGVLELILSSGNNVLKVYSTRCRDILLKKFSFNLPKFNVYSLRKECKELEEYNLDVCDSNYQAEINDEYFYKVVNSYLNDDNDNDDNESFINKVVDFLSNYYLFILGGVVLLVVIIVAFLRMRKRRVLE